MSVTVSPPVAGWRRSARIAMWSLVLAAAAVLIGCNERRNAALDTLRDPASTTADQIRALRVLQQLEGAKGAELVAQSLAHPSKRVRLAAVRALGAMGADGSLRQLVPGLQDPSREVRLAVIRLLGGSTHSRAPQLLIPLLEDADHAIRRTAAQALVALGVSAREQRKRLAKRQLEQQIRAVGSLNDQLRANAASQLGLSGRASVVAPLARRLRDPSPTVREAVARALGRLGGSAARSALVGLAGDPDASFRRAAAVGLVELASPPWEAVGALLADPAAENRYVVLAGIERATTPPPPAVVSKVCQELGASDDQRAIAAAQAIGANEHLECPEVINGLIQRAEALAAATQNGAPELAAAIAPLYDRLVALGCRRCAPAMFGLTRRAYALFRREAMKWIPVARWRELDGRQPVVSSGARPPKTAGREAALTWLLTRYPTQDRPTESDPLLPPALGAARISAMAGQLVRATARLALGAEVRRWLGAHAGPDQPIVARVAFLNALASWAPGRDVMPASAPTDGAAARSATVPVPESHRRGGAPVAVQDPVVTAVLAALPATEDDLRAAAAGCLAYLPVGAEERGVELLADPVPAVRDAAVSALGQLRAKSAVTPLLEQLEQHPSPLLVEALGRIGDARAFGPIARLLERDHPLARRPAERAVVVAALAGFPSRQAVELLALELTYPHPEIRLAAAEALGRMGRTEAVAHLGDGEEDFYQQVRAACRRAREGLRPSGSAPPS